MEDVRPVNVNHHIAVLAFGVAIARHMRTSIENVDAMSHFGKFAGHDRAGKSGTDDGNMSGGLRHLDSLNQWLI